MTTPDETVDNKDGDELTEEHTKSFLGHLDDLRKTILYSVAALVLGMLIAIPLAPYMRQLIKIPLEMASLGDAAPELKVLNVTGGVVIATRLVFWTGMLFSLPVIVMCLCNFVFPGLTKIEKSTFTRASGFAIVLFIAGVCLGFFMTIPVALRFMIVVNDWIGTSADWWEEADYIAFILKILLAFGLVFQLPVILLALGSMGVVNSRQLMDKRKHVIVGLMIMAMLLTPADPGTMLLMGMPLIALFEGCIWLIWLKERRKKREAEAEAD